MAHPCDYPVYCRVTGENKKTMIAKFSDLVDAVKWARARSWEHPYNAANQTLIVYSWGRVYRKFSQGVEK